MRQPRKPASASNHPLNSHNIVLTPWAKTQSRDIDVRVCDSPVCISGVEKIGKPGAPGTCAGQGAAAATLNGAAGVMRL